VSDAQAFGFWTALTVATGVAILVASLALGPRRRHASKLDPYECGVPLFQDARQRFSVQFYLMALAFLLFDIEIVFLLPWALVYRRLGAAGVWTILIFVGVLGVGYLYIWKRRVIDWDP
jgi:NADH-quinone oxidoreductase subunit A